MWEAQRRRRIKSNFGNPKRNHCVSRVNAIRPVSPNYLRHELATATLNLDQITDDRSWPVKTILVFTKLCLGYDFAIF